ncbi:hypothetical protein SNE510_72860 [Streptomyces sp. NE5-10]|uniref:hypothetical protein n=1 Tax=Streptomyces sp. NE5-10 TaxID=2759674 RepID=UPI001A48C01A|nr:hypothetical protein [Streptomyces sp. NE5-10]GHJ97767.1 hypothetical protein SNE510_72860 [Streptomyces sp. NE5-10]
MTVGVVMLLMGAPRLGAVMSFVLGNRLWHVGDRPLAAAPTAVATSGVWAAARAVKCLEPVALLIAMVTVSVAVALLAADVELVRGIVSVPATLPSFTAPT